MRNQFVYVAVGSITFSLLFIVLLHTGSLEGQNSAVPRHIVFNIGMPKAGSTSLANYLSCMGYSGVSHWDCTPRKYFVRKKQTIYCGQCIERAIARNSSLDAECGSHTAYTQMDREEVDCFFPQILHIEYLDAHYPNAKFIMLHRDAAEWISSVRRWRRSMHLRMLRCMHLLKVIDISPIVSAVLPTKRQSPLTVPNFTEAWTRIYDLADGDRILQSVMIKHEEKMIEKFKHRPQIFLFVNLTDPNIESKLYDFLDVNTLMRRYKCWGKFNKAP